ncbi:Phage-related baseplate assembly protein [Pseudovibrio sp. Ad46]|uniref:type VI secretion system Vgr family protein n=1 Tax=unclassified Pseudovibrio TaxID=2627060 RepID=UPI00070DD9FF|nr:MULTISPECIES: type VI secretion system tip protein TssI/VgrG [unclassified Pseudovibrio]KZK85562.1 Phage-related baseplate assembly protein [Pseudovibrio sp. Ad46]KZK97731.1 Phage-related baseplate assembly protein [Pseudovibrio sp. Ad5]
MCASKVTENRLFTISFDGGDDSFHLWKMKMTSEMSELYEMVVDCRSFEHDLSLDKMLGQTLTLEMKKVSGTSLSSDQYLNGFVTKAIYTGQDHGYSTYRLIVRPWLWFLTLTSNCRIFQEKSTPDILKEVFQEAGFTDFKNKLSDSYDPRPYCAQFQETDFNFICRLMEQEGIYYYFEHEDGQHTMVLADSYSAHEDIKGESSLPFYSEEDHFRRGADHFWDWRHNEEIQTDEVEINDYDFTKPTSDLKANASEKKSHQLSGRTRYMYPGHYEEVSVGEKRAKVRVEEASAAYAKVYARGNVRGLRPGYLFKLDQFSDDPSQEKEYLITKAICEVSIEFARDEEQEFYDAITYEIEAVDSSVQYRKASTTPWPNMNGLQSAVVTGADGEEIWTDEYGRIKVQFHWDRDGQNDDKSSCWVRVAQMWAGKGWGGLHIPRVGQEVLVDFLDGDPDRPIVVGSVYNGEQTVPYDLPGEATKSTLKSETSKEGGGNNEFLFEDKKDEELVQLTAEKDYERTVKNNETVKIGFDKQEDGDQTIEVYNNRNLTVDQGDETYTIKTGGRTTTVEKDDALSVKSGNHTITVESGDQSISMKQGAQTVEAMKDIGVTSQTGDVKVDASAGSVKVSGTQAIELTCGGSSIKMDPMSITLTAGPSSLKLEAAQAELKGLMVTVKGDVQATVDGTLTTLKGAGITTVQGALVKIN